MLRQDLQTLYVQLSLRGNSSSTRTIFDRVLLGDKLKPSEFPRHRRLPSSPSRLQDVRCGGAWCSAGDDGGAQTMDRLHICKPATKSYVFALLLALAAYPLHAVAQPRPASVTVNVDRASSSAPAGPISLFHTVEGEDAAAMADHGRNRASTSMWGDRPCCGSGTGSGGFLGASSSWEDQLRVLTPDAALGEYVVVAFSIGLYGHMERTQTYYVHSDAQVRHSMSLNLALLNFEWVTGHEG